ncbi:hypothetical protein CPB84DRAFT_1821370 [Gymnopilus junonius]|uniref:DUF2415 domain-containing protein n=1 Tax=Gymnopilus junonius TaxID=109634 RepID=A0A9P5NVE3_GYMJU|nr:hypothetical protein CPB84DRAFT_1821370 [Gymnopilus junonius]
MARDPSLLDSNQPLAIAPAQPVIAHVQLRDLLICPREQGVVDYIGPRAIVEQDMHTPGAPTRILSRLTFTPNSLTYLPVGVDDTLIAAGGQEKEIHLSLYTPHSSSASGSASVSSRSSRSRRTRQVWEYEDKLQGSINNSVLLTSLSLTKSNQSSVEPRVGVSNNDGTVRLYDVPMRVHNTKRKLKSVGEVRLDVAINHSSISPDGRTLLSVGDSNKIYFHQLTGSSSHITFEPITTLTIPPPDLAPFYAYHTSLTAAFSTAFSGTDPSSPWRARKASWRCGMGCDGRWEWGGGGTGGGEGGMFGNQRTNWWLSDDPWEWSRGKAPGWCVRSVKFNGGEGARMGKEVMAFTEHTSLVHLVDARTFETHDIIRVPTLLRPSNSSSSSGSRDPSSSNPPRRSASAAASGGSGGSATSGGSGISSSRRTSSSFSVPGTVGTAGADAGQAEGLTSTSTATTATTTAVAQARTQALAQAQAQIRDRVQAQAQAQAQRDQAQAQDRARTQRVLMRRGLPVSNTRAQMGLQIQVRVGSGPSGSGVGAGAGVGSSTAAGTTTTTATATNTRLPSPPPTTTVYQGLGQSQSQGQSHTHPPSPLRISSSSAGSGSGSTSQSPARTRTHTHTHTPGIVQALGDAFRISLPSSSSASLSSPTTPARTASGAGAGAGFGFGVGAGSSGSGQPTTPPRAATAANTISRASSYSPPASIGDSTWRTLGGGAVAGSRWSPSGTSPVPVSAPVFTPVFTPAGAGGAGAGGYGAGASGGEGSSTNTMTTRDEDEIDEDEDGDATPSLEDLIRRLREVQAREEERRKKEEEGIVVVPDLGDRDVENEVHALLAGHGIQSRFAGEGDHDDDDGGAAIAGVSVAAINDASNTPSPPPIVRPERSPGSASASSSSSGESEFGRMSDSAPILGPEDVNRLFEEVIQRRRARRARAHSRSPSPPSPNSWTMADPTSDDEGVNMVVIRVRHDDHDEPRGGQQQRQQREEVDGDGDVNMMDVDEIENDHDHEHAHAHHHQDTDDIEVDASEEEEDHDRVHHLVYALGGGTGLAANLAGGSASGAGGDMSLGRIWSTSTRKKGMGMITPFADAEEAWVWHYMEEEEDEQEGEEGDDHAGVEFEVEREGEEHDDEEEERGEDEEDEETGGTGSGATTSTSSRYGYAPRGGSRSASTSANNHNQYKPRLTPKSSSLSAAAARRYGYYEDLDLAGLCFDPWGERMYVAGVGVGGGGTCLAVVTGGERQENAEVGVGAVVEWGVRGAEKRWWVDEGWM